MPAFPRPEREVLRELEHPLAFLFWEALRDVLLWNSVGPEERRGLFHPSPPRVREYLAYALLQAPELEEALRGLRVVSELPELAEEARVAEACAGVALWAEARGMKETAVQFAEAAARVEPEVSARSFTAGRLCRRLGDAPRAAMWYARAARLARIAYRRRRKGSEIDFANAHLGHGNLEHDLGNYREAEFHYMKAARAALRSGRKSLAAMANHSMVGVAGDTSRHGDALEYARKAVALYPADHPLFPALVHDVARLWMGMGYFSSALLLLERVLPRMERPDEKMVVAASLARSAAAVKDHIRYERTTAYVLATAAADTGMAASSLYHVAEGARSFWEWERATAMAEKALDIARQRDNGTIIALAERLLESLARREPGDVDLVPEEGGIIDALTRTILRKLRAGPPSA
ncbi:MAG TPA: hypothetical protein VHG28_21170 [Longimicrobiaceae bacterium]|nr:hypothetical protein [Longimicrobiaceae bacterium]